MSKEKKEFKGKEFTVTYLGGALDHTVTPQKLNQARGAQKRQVTVPAKTEFHEIETFHLWGYDLPKGEPVKVADRDPALLSRGMSLSQLHAKLTALGPERFELSK